MMRNGLKITGLVAGLIIVAIFAVVMAIGVAQDIPTLLTQGWIAQRTDFPKPLYMVLGFLLLLSMTGAMAGLTDTKS